ncbi:SIMPL domain-containing protein [Luteimonas sp. R10]|uniref:SIMPL domain-containing protein n=1 Tax=Luteimonas sp. R10 TaxID=3108176 RepID=UPI00308D06A4|nr:SIMPL domain-containing protein [Luteimonas sp. R10]
MTRRFLLPLLLAALPAVPAMTANAQTSMPETTRAAAAADGTLLSVSAQAEASRVPDVATLSAGVVTQATDANAALRANAERMNALMAAIRAAGIAEKDVQTSGLNVHPQYHHSDNAAPTITGYQASNTVSLKVRDIAALGEVLDALVASGANQVNGPSFEIDQPDAVYDEARQAALQKAQQRARMYAQSLGMRVRRIVSISEGGGFMPPPRPMMRMEAAAMDMASSPVSPGQTTLTANLDVVFELED